MKKVTRIINIIIGCISFFIIQLIWMKRFKGIPIVKNKNCTLAAQQAMVGASAEIGLLWIFPIIYVSDSFFEFFTEKEQKAIFWHEYGHMAEYHRPFPIFTNLQLYIEREIVCDNYAVENGLRKEMLSALIKLRDSRPFILRDADGFLNDRISYLSQF